MARSQPHIPLAMDPMTEPDDSTSTTTERDDAARPPNMLQVILSVFAAAVGVQSKENRERDFANGNPVAFIIAGLIFTVVFVLTLIGVVNLVL